MPAQARELAHSPHEVLGNDAWVMAECSTTLANQTAIRPTLTWASALTRRHTSCLPAWRASYSICSSNNSGSPYDQSLDSTHWLCMSWQLWLIALPDTIAACLWYVSLPSGCGLLTAPFCWRHRTLHIALNIWFPRESVVLPPHVLELVPKLRSVGMRCVLPR